MFDVAVILINYNSSKYTLQCIDAVIKHTNKSNSYQIIVVDNCSKTLDYKNLESNFPIATNIILHRSEINTGFGGGNMMGAKLANANYLLFLNNDAFLLNDCIAILKSYSESHPKVGVTTAQNYDEHGKFVPSFDHNKGIRRLLFGRGFLEAINSKRYPNRNKEYSTPITVDWVNGAFLFFKTSVFKKIGGFDTSIFLYWEEMDICERLRKHNFTAALVPEARITHIQGVSIGTSKAINMESYISYLYVVKKHFGNFRYLLIKNYLSLLFLFKKKKSYLRPTILNENRMDNSLRYKQTKP
ncbi:glycosyl transferase [Patiriisocius marinistellae]|uniref:Glycosyl transferase n=1 Tax=Patiriisocius marinistellae TaxID=2494560 RepID=A0A5J4G0J7_9FLAO|nr:glycosyltransferase family 2 protein [Patiriisocius marinistellae]GEQ85835.1 glycosyl transferase [Patiriisocius marinistellae]